MPLTIIVGAQWGDEGKGRIVDLLAAKADVVARYNGGDNAGHTVAVGENLFKLHLLPSGLVHEDPVGVLGNGMVINPATLLKEMNKVSQAGISVTPERLKISQAAHLITPGHLALDAAREQARGAKQLGTTRRGIGPAYTSKVTRSGIRMESMLDLEGFRVAMLEHIAEVNLQLTRLYDHDPLEGAKIQAEYLDYAKQLKPYLTDTGSYLQQALREERSILAEGAQGTLLDLDHGTYPFVTSSTPTAPGALVGLGLGIGLASKVIGVVKAFQTRVGEGPFPTELEGNLALKLRGTGENQWDEFGTTTGRPRRVGWLDTVLLRYAVRVNGITELALTKLDILSGFEQVKICTGYRTADGMQSDLSMGPGKLGGFQALYVDVPGWDLELSSVRGWDELPRAARNYVKQIEDLCGVPIKTISVGPERSQVILRH
jgi:adenylosuccinate synthase